jgi:hypothetical protein
VNVAKVSPKPAAFILWGALASTGRSMRRAFGHREGTVRLAPPFKSTVKSLEKPLTEPADCTATNGREPLRSVAFLPRSVMVPEPTDTTQSAPSTASSTSARASSSACSSSL